MPSAARDFFRSASLRNSIASSESIGTGSPSPPRKKMPAQRRGYVAGDVTTELRWLLEKNDLASSALIVDPPATGLSAEMRRAILDAPPHRMVYVSCNPPTLARDIAELRQRFTVIAITPFDMFPQTAEIEAITHLESL